MPATVNDIDFDTSPPTETKTVSEPIEQVLPHARRGGNRYAVPRSALWTARRLKEDKPESAIAILRLWTHEKHARKTTYELLDKLNSMYDDSVIQALQELGQP